MSTSVYVQKQVVNKLLSAEAAKHGNFTVPSDVEGPTGVGRVGRRSKLRLAAGAQQRSINEAVLGAQSVAAQAEALRSEARSYRISVAGAFWGW